MSVKTLHDTIDQTWFITFTCFDWIPLFEITKSYDLVYNWLNFIKLNKQVETLAFVIMPNHLHLILHLGQEKIDLNKMVGNGKRFIAYELVKRLTANDEETILQNLANACSEKERSKGQIHKIFKSSFDGKPIYTEKFFYQKLDYIHHNPVSGKWNLCNDFTEYKHSSAAFYELGIKHEFLDITDFREIL